MSQLDDKPEVEANGGEIHAQPPEAFTGLRLSAVKKSAAGLPAVVSSMWRVWREMGVIRGLRALRALNQPGERAELIA